MGFSMTTRQRDGKWVTKGSGTARCEIQVEQAQTASRVPERLANWRSQAMARCNRCNGGPCAEGIGST